MRIAKLFYYSIIILLLIGCSGKDMFSKQTVIEVQESNTNELDPLQLKTNKEAIMDFVNNDLLKSITIERLYEIDNVLKELGEIKSETIESAVINYEGMMGKTIRKIEYQRYYTIVFQLDNGREIFGYLQLKNDMEYKIFTIGTDINKSINLDGDSITKWNDNNISIFAYEGFQDGWDLRVSVEIDGNKMIEKVAIYVGGI